MSAASSCLALVLRRSESPMENFEENNQSKDKLLEPPPLGDSFIEDEDVNSSIKPRFSPLPRRRSSVSSDEGDLEPPTTVARKVSFADAFGFDLVSVKEFDTWEVPIVSQLLSYEVETNYIEEFYLTASFTLPSADDIIGKVQAKKVLLESIDMTPGTSSMKGIIRVLNVSYEKQTYVRMSLDDWQTYYDLTAEYIPYSFNGDTDQFAFTITLVPPYQKEGASVQFCICYETPIGTFWDNNDGQNYTLICHKKECAVEKDHPSEDLAEKLKKSCLKSTPSKEEDDLDESEEKYSRSKENYIPRIICTHDENTEDNNSEEDNNSQEKDKEADDDLELLLNQNLMKARIISTEDNKNSKIQIIEELPDLPRLPDTVQTSESLECLKESSTGTFKKFNDNISAIDSKKFNRNEECLTVKESSQTLVAEDIKSKLCAEQHLKESGISLKEYLPQNGGQQTKHEDLHLLKQKEGLTTDFQDDTSVLQGKEAEKWSPTTNINRKPYDDIETTLSLKTESVQLIENLDDNANSNDSHNIADASYFSIYNVEKIKDENNQFPELEKTDRCSFDKSESSQLEQGYSTISLKQKYTAPVVSEDPDKIDEQSFSRSPDAEHERPSHDVDCDCKIFKNTVSVENLTISDHAVPNLAFSCNICLDNQGQIKGIDENTSEANSVTTTFYSPCDTTDFTSNQGSLEALFENKNTKEMNPHMNDSQTIHLQKSSQSYISTFNHSPNPIHSDYQHDKTYFICEDKSEESQIFEQPLITSKAPMTSQNQEDIKGNTAVVDAPDLELYKTNSIKIDWPLHTTDRAQSTENQLTVGEKVIIALVTEETSESEISIPGRDHTNVSYIDVCSGVSKNTLDKADNKSGMESELEKVSDNSNEGDGGRSKEIKSEEIHFPLDDKKDLASVGRDGDNGQIQRTIASKMPGADAIYMGAYNVFKDQFKSRLDDFSNNLATVDESDSQVTDFSDTESSNNLCVEVSGNFCKESDTSNNSISSGSTTDMSGMLHAPENTEHNSLRPSILISEPDDELEAWCTDDEEKSEPEVNYYSEKDQKAQTGDHGNKDDSMSSDPFNFSKTSSKVICSVMFVVFSGLMYHYDFLVCFALYLFSLYWLYWEGDGNKKAVRKD
eukprot:XP_004913037.1 PREDICTED: protein phosphatase 1 regulatory subunit 3A [Xenopus tropicalis]